MQVARSSTETAIVAFQWDTAFGASLSNAMLGGNLQRVIQSQLAICPVAWKSPMVRHRNDAKFFSCNLIDDAVRKSAEMKATTRATKNCTDHRVFKNKCRRPLELSDELEAELKIRLFRIKFRSITQLGERKRNNNELHFNVARTCARAAAIGTT